MKLNLEGKVAIVTGGAGDLGRGTALALATEGAHVVVADFDMERAESVADDVTQLGGHAIFVKVDVTDGDQVKAMVQQTIDTFGKIDILVNSAGILGPQKPVVEFDEDAWDTVIGVNLKGTFMCAKAVLPHMINNNYGRIINISSIAGKTGEPFNTAYCASKAAVINFTQGLALEVAPHKITVNAVCPAGLGNAMSDHVFAERSRYLGITPEEARQQFLASFPLGQPLSVEDVVQMIMFLSSDVSSQITGEAVNVTGGVEVH